MPDLLYRPLTEITRLLSERKLSPVELMEATLARIDATHETLGAFVALRSREELLAEAEVVVSSLLDPPILEICCQMLPKLTTNAPQTNHNSRKLG